MSNTSPKWWKEAKIFLPFEGMGEREGRKKKDSFQNSSCHSPPPPGEGQTGQSGWESKQKSVSLAPGSKQSDPRAPETELDDIALWGVGRTMCCADSKAFPACFVSRYQHAMSLKTNSMAKPAKRNDKGAWECRRFLPISLDGAMDHLLLPYLDVWCLSQSHHYATSVCWCAGPDGHFKSLDNHFSGFLAKTWEN